MVIFSSVLKQHWKLNGGKYVRTVTGVKVVMVLPTNKDVNDSCPHTNPESKPAQQTQTQTHARVCAQALTLSCCSASSKASRERAVQALNCDRRTPSNTNVTLHVPSCYMTKGVGHVRAVASVKHSTYPFVFHHSMEYMCRVIPADACSRSYVQT